MPDQIISSEGYQKIKDELDYLTNVKRKEIAERIEIAKELGDLSENAEYSEAKDAQALNDGRVIELTNLLKNVTVVDASKSRSKISLGSTIKVKMGGKEKQFTIVSFNEADPLEGKISNESPLGMAFLEKHKGDKVVVETPKGNITCEILDIH